MYIKVVICWHQNWVIESTVKMTISNYALTAERLQIAFCTRIVKPVVLKLSVDVLSSVKVKRFSRHHGL